jgi:hypothetical protein
MTIGNLTFKSFCLLVMPLASLSAPFILPAKAEQKTCGLYNMQGELVYDRTAAILDLTHTVFDKPTDISAQLKNCKAALNEAIDQQVELNANACSDSPQKLVGIFVSEGQRAEVARGRSVNKTYSYSETRYNMVLICEPLGWGRGCVNRYRPIPYQVNSTASSCRLSA